MPKTWLRTQNPCFGFAVDCLREGAGIQATGTLLDPRNPEFVPSTPLAVICVDVEDRMCDFAVREFGTQDD